MNSGFRGMFGSWAGENRNPAPPAPSGTPNPQQNSAPPANGAAPNGQQNDTSNDGVSVDDIWKQVKTEDDNKKQADDPPANNQNQNQQTPEERVAAYLKTQGLEPIVLSDADKEALRNGDFDGVLSQINQKITNAHIKAVNAANQLITTKLPQMVEEAVNKSRSYVDGVELKKFIQNDPNLKGLANNPIFAPNVEAIFQQFLGKGATKEQASKGTKAYFDKMVQAYDPSAQVNGNRGGNFRTPQSSGAEDWLSVLKGS